MAGRLLDFEECKVKAGDRIVRGIAAGGMIRAFAIDGRKTVQTARDNHQASPVVAAALGRLLMACQMMGCMLKTPDELTTIIVRGDGPIGALTVTADNNGNVKGYANHPNVWLPLNGLKKLDVGGAIGSGTMTVIRDQPGIEPYTSQVELVSGEIGDDLTSYFVMSDQVPTSVGLGVLVGTDLNIKQAGGFIIQLMPGYDDYLVDELEANLSQIKSVTSMMEEGMTPEDILEYALRGLDFVALETIPARFHCGCDIPRATRVALALGKDEIEDIIAKNEPAELYCHFCGNRFEFSPEELQEILNEALK